MTIGDPPANTFEGMKPLKLAESVVPYQSETDLAVVLRNEMRQHLEAVCSVMNRATKQGLQINFQVARDGFGRNVVQTIDVLKPL